MAIYVKEKIREKKIKVKNEEEKVKNTIKIVGGGATNH